MHTQDTLHENIFIAAAHRLGYELSKNDIAEIRRNADFSINCQDTDSAISTAMLYVKEYLRGLRRM